MANDTHISETSVSKADEFSEYYRVTGLTWKNGKGHVQPRYDFGAKGENVIITIGTEIVGQDANGKNVEREVQITLQDLFDSYFAMMKTIKMIAPASSTAPSVPSRFPLWIDTNSQDQYISYYE